MTDENANSPYYLIDARAARGKVLLAAIVFSTVLFAVFAIKWQVGNLLGELTPANDPNASEVARIALALSPHDPMPNWLAATKAKEDFTPQGIERSVRMFENVVKLSPYDFRWWIELGRAYEQAEKTQQAENAFKRAVDLAPTYTYTHWQFGNFYLRQNRPDEAFAELRKTTEQSISYREQVFSLAWDYFDKDPRKVEELAADTPDVKATLASFFALRGQAEDALRVWNTLTDEQKAPHEKFAKDIAQGLFDRRFYRQALEFARQTGIDPEAKFATVSNPGFEQLVAGSEKTLFGWRINRNEGRADALPDSTTKTEGQRSMKISFRAFTKPELYTLAQVVALEPGRSYRLTFMLRSENLKSAGPPLLKVTGGPQNTVLAATAPFQTGTTDWKPMSLEFKVPENADGIEIVTARALCPEECPLSGTIWYDDFRLAPL